MLPETVIALLKSGKTKENAVDYDKAVEIAVECVRYWKATSAAAELLRERERVKTR